MERPTSPWIPVGIDGIAEHLQVSENTVVTWRRRSAKEWVTVAKFPEPAGKISGRDWWWLADILKWAEETGRLKDSVDRGKDLRAMTAQPYEPHRTPEEIQASIKDDRSPRALRAALPPEDHALFDREYRTALDQAKVSYDLTPVQEFQTRWWMEAVQKADPEEYAETIRAAERATEYLERGETPPGAIRWNDALDAQMRERIERGK